MAYCDAIYNQFYQQEYSKNNFNDITDDVIEEIKQDIEKHNKFYSSEEPVLPRRHVIMRALRYLKEYNFDYKIIYYILAVDPELLTLKEFVKAKIIKKSDLEKITDISEKKKLIKIRNEQIDDFSKNMQEILGFYDPKIITYEQLYYKKFIKNNEKVAIKTK